MVSASKSSSRTVIQVSVPDWQKTEWEDHATDLDMSLSEFIRSMVQAGRNGYSRGEEPIAANDPPPTANTRPTESADELDHLYDHIEEHQPVAWEDIVSVLTDNIEQKADAELRELEEAGRIRHSGPDGGYVVLE